VHGIEASGLSLTTAADDWRAQAYLAGRAA